MFALIMVIFGIGVVGRRMNIRIFLGIIVWTLITWIINILWDIENSGLSPMLLKQKKDASPDSEFLPQELGVLLIIVVDFI